MSNQGVSSPSLVIRHTGQVFALTQAPVTIGRLSDNTIVLADPQVSRHHANVTWQAGAFVIQDLGSANGTYVNDKRITGPQTLRDGDVIQTGNTQFDVQLAPAAGEADRTMVGDERDRRRVSVRSAGELVVDDRDSDRGDDPDMQRVFVGVDSGDVQTRSCDCHNRCASCFR